MRFRLMFAFVVAAHVGDMSAQNLIIGAYPSQNTARLGDVVTWTVVAELLNVPDDRSVLATVTKISFDVDHGGDTGVLLSDNTFAPGFFNFFTPDNGIINGDSIDGTFGIQVIPPLGAPDSSNPLSMYTYNMLITDDTPRLIESHLNIFGLFTGQYEGDLVGNAILYQNDDGSPGDVPYSVPPISLLPPLEIVPSPASLAGLTGIVPVIYRRRRSV